MPIVSDVKMTGEDQFLVQVGDIGFQSKPVGDDRMYIYAISKFPGIERAAKYEHFFIFIFYLLISSLSDLNFVTHGIVKNFLIVMQLLIHRMDLEVIH